MKILLFGFNELGPLGGVEVVILNLAQKFREKGHSVGILEIAKQYKSKRLLDDGTPVWGITVSSMPDVRRPRSWASFARTTWQFMRVVREFKPDIVHVHFPLSQCMPVVGASYLPHSWRTVVTVHNSDIRVAPVSEPTLRPWQSRLFTGASAVTSVNQALLDDALAMFTMIGSKGQVILNGVGTRWFQPLENNGSGQDYLLFSGRLSHVKGADLLLQAWGKVHSNYPQTNLWLAGDGEEREKLEQMAKDLGIYVSVKFMGRKNQDELLGLYRHARAVVLPSRREGLPLSLLEAGASGAICVGSRTPGIPEIIQDGVTGYLVDTESVTDLSAGLKKVLDLPGAARTQMKQAAQEAIRSRFTEEKMTSSYLELFESIRAK